MYTLKMSYGYVDEPETETVESLGTYETHEEAIKAAASKFSEIMDYIADPCEVCFGEIETCLDEYYVTYGDFDAELGRVFAGYNHYYKVNVNERYGV